MHSIVFNIILPQFEIMLILKAQSDKTPVINLLVFKQNYAKALHPSSIPRNHLCLSGFQGLNGTNPPFITLHLPSFSLGKRFRIYALNRKASKYKAASIVNEAYFVEQ